MAKRLTPHSVDAAENGVSTEAPKRRGRPRAAAAPSNVSNETIAEYTDKARQALAEFEEAQAEAKSLQASYRGVLKEAKKNGVDADSIRWYLKQTKREPEDIERELRNRARIAKIMGLPVGTQLDFFVEDAPLAANGAAADFATVGAA